MDYIVETYRPAYPQKGVHVAVHRPQDWPDCANPGMTTAWRVEGCRTKQEAIAAALEKGAGFPVTVYLMSPVRGREGQVL